MKLDGSLDKLLSARKKLNSEQGRVARKNARKAFLAALRECRARVDEDFPNIPKKRTSRRKRNPRRAVRGKLLISQQMHRQLLAAGVRPHHFVERGKTGELAHKIYAPRWMAQAWMAGFDAKAIASAVRSRKQRRKIEALVRLGKSK